MDTSTFIERLDEDLGVEYQPIVRPSKYSPFLFPSAVDGPVVIAFVRLGRDAKPAIIWSVDAAIKAVN